MSKVNTEAFLKLYKAGFNASQAAKLAGISRPAASRWYNLFRQHKVPQLSLAEQAEALAFPGLTEKEIREELTKEITYA